jgi:hypothetical protein
MKITKSRLKQIIREAISPVPIGGFDSAAMFRHLGHPNDSSQVCVSVHAAYDDGWHAIWESKANDMRTAKEVANGVGTALDIALCATPAASVAIMENRDGKWLIIEEF